MSDEAQTRSEANESRVDSEIRLRVQRLNSLLEGRQASVELTGFGPAAIEPLRQFLFAGSPSGIFQPRQWAVEALAAIGAKDVLVSYLARDERIADPVVRQGEDAVRNTAARLITRWKTDDVFEVLLALGKRRVLPGVIHALGLFGRPKALPVLERALEDDIARPAAEEALVQFGDQAIATLVATANRKRLNEGEEIPSSLLRRRAAVQVLSDSTLEESLWPKLRFLLDESDAELVVHAAKIASIMASDTDKMHAAAAVLRVLPESPWHVKEEAVECLSALYGLAEPLIDAEIERRSAQPPLKRATDEALLALMRLRRHVHDRI